MCIVFYKHPTESSWHYYQIYYSEKFAKRDIDLLVKEGRDIKTRLTNLEN